MSKVEILRVLVNQRLTAAVGEVFELFERTIADYEEELSCSKRENELQRKLLDAVLKPEVRLHRTDVQYDPEHPHIKEEQEELWRSQDGSVSVKSEGDEEKAQSSQLYQTAEDNREAEPPASRSAQQMKRDTNGGDCGGSGPARNLDPDICLQPDSFVETVNSKQTQTGVSVSQAASNDRISDSSEPETENGDDDWKETRECQSHLITLKKRSVAVGDQECNTGKRFLSCSKCGKTFETKDCLQSHMKGPSGKKTFVCSICVKRCTQSMSLLATHNRTCSGEKAFGCSVCKKQFSYKGDVVRHMRTHTGEKPFSCSVCGKRFSQSTGLGSHMRTHTGEKPYSCSVCHQRFIRSGILARHMRVHTGEKPYSCSLCNTTFSLSQSLLKHMRIHTGEKPFSCSICDKRFTQKGHLTQHMTLHTGERSFGCSVCGKKFTRQSRVKKHKCVSDNSNSKHHEKAPKSG